MVLGSWSKMLEPQGGYTYLTCTRQVDINTYAYVASDGALAISRICMLTHWYVIIFAVGKMGRAIILLFP